MAWVLPKEVKSEYSSQRSGSWHNSCTNLTFTPGARLPLSAGPKAHRKPLRAIPRLQNEIVMESRIVYFACVLTLHTPLSTFVDIQVFTACPKASASLFCRQRHLTAMNSVARRFSSSVKTSGTKQ